MIKSISKNLKYKLKTSIKILYFRFALIALLIKDYRRYKKSAIGMKSNLSKSNLESSITKAYHSIEKGLSKTNFRYGFGYEARKKLIDNLMLYRKKYPMRNRRYLIGLDVLYSYVERHNGTEHNFKDINEILKSSRPLPNGSKGGTIRLLAKDITDSCKASFDEFSKTRYSIREFSSKEVSISQLKKAINLSLKTPSACNRQEWRATIIQNKNTIERLLNIQSGLKVDNGNLPTIIMVTSNASFSEGPRERHLAYIDGGMFAMQLINSLHFFGLGTCPLSACLNGKQDKSLRTLLNVPEEEVFIMFIAVGHYKKEFFVPQSERINLEEIIRNIN